MIQNLGGQAIGAELVSATTGGAFVGPVSVYVTIDAGTQTLGAVGGGGCQAEGNGFFTYRPSAAETNGTLIAFTFVGSGAVPATIQVATLQAGQQAALGGGAIPGPDSVTALSLIQLAFETLGIYAADETIPAAAAHAAYRRLRQMITGWALAPQIASVVGREVWPLVTGQGGSTTPISIGPTGTWQTTRPQRLAGAGLLLAGVTPTAEIPLGILTDDAYAGIRQKDLASLYPTGVYYTPQTVPPSGNGTVQLWPVPSVNTNSLVLYRLDPLGQFATLTTQYLLPDGYPEAVHYNLAVRLCAPYGLPVPADVGALAVQSLATIKRANTRIRDLANDLAAIGPRRGTYSILLGNG